MVGERIKPRQFETKVSRRRGLSKAILLSINDDKLNMVPPKSMIINQPVKSGESSVRKEKK